MNIQVKAIENLVNSFNAGKINEEDFFRAVNNSVRVGLDDVRRMKAFNVKNEIMVGDMVKVNHKKVVGRSFRVREIKRVKAILVNPINERESFNVPLSLIEKF